MTPGAQKIKTWREDPVQFVRDNFHVEPDLWQKDALMAVGGQANPRRRLCMKACTGPGKSTALAWIGWHRLSCFADLGEHPKGAAISGEGRENLSDNLWAELSKWQQRSDFLKAAFTWRKEQITANGHSETWFLSARSYPKDADSEAIGRSLSGLHSRYPFLLLDETGDMPIAIGQKSTQIFTGGVVDGLIAQAGNPTSTSGLLYHTSTHERDLWTIITITADPDDPKRTPRVDLEHAAQQIKMYGRDNPWIKATILGEFPPQGFNALLALDDVEKAMRRNLTPDVYERVQKRIGIDVARFGDDRTILFPRQGLNAAGPKVIEMRGARSNEISDRAQLAHSNWARKGTSDIMILVDGTGGYGSGVIDSLLMAGLSPQDIQFAGKASDSRFANKRAEIWWNMAEWVKRGGALPQIPGLVKELTSPTYTFQKGSILIEPKEALKKRIGVSPDIADALALTFAYPDMPAEIVIPGAKQQSRHLSEYDPFEERE